MKFLEKKTVEKKNTVIDKDDWKTYINHHNEIHRLLIQSILFVAIWTEVVTCSTNILSGFQSYSVFFEFIVVHVLLDHEWKFIALCKNLGARVRGVVSAIVYFVSSLLAHRLVDFVGTCTRQDTACIIYVVCHAWRACLAWRLCHAWHRCHVCSMYSLVRGV